jgi:nitroreductase
MLDSLIKKNRSYRRFDQKKTISTDVLRKLVNYARLSPSSANIQPLKYYLSNSLLLNKLIFPTLSWAGYLKDWQGPAEGERPSAYIIILGDTNVKKNFSIDPGICAQSIMLGAVEEGFGGCMIGSIKKEQLRNNLSISEQYEILLVLALGEPIEEILIDEINENESIKYWRDNNSVHHVPKRRLNDIIR